MPKPKKCAICETEFEPKTTLHKVCGLTCTLELGRIKKEKKAARERKAFNKETRRMKSELRANDKGFQLKKAQRAFNKFIRLRDKDEPCISCGREEVEWTPGGQWDCGHFRSVGAQPALRFEEDNGHKQCKSCNGGSAKYAKKGHTVAQEYEIRLPKKIGQKRVDWLKQEHEKKRYSAQDYIDVYNVYNSKCKEMEE